MYTRRVVSHLMIIFIFDLIGTSQADFITTGETFTINAGRLNTSILLVLKNHRSITSCIMKCMDHTKCKMVNFNDESHQCELIGQPVGDIETENHPDWKNYRIPQEQIMSTTKCKDCPCGHGYMDCEDIEEFPGYRCICKEAYIGARCTVNKESKMIVIGKEEEIRKNNLITTVETMEKEFDVSFEVKPTSVSTEHQSIIHLTDSGEDDQSYGSRTPAIWTKNGKLYICGALNGKKTCYYFSVPFPTGNWISVKITQRKVMSNYIFSVTINGEVVHTIINNDPRIFHNVQVFVANPWGSVQPGLIRNFVLYNWKS